MPPEPFQTPARVSGFERLGLKACRFGFAVLRVRLRVQVPGVQGFGFKSVGLCISMFCQPPGMQDIRELGSS